MEAKIGELVFGVGGGDADCHARISALFRMKSVRYCRNQRAAVGVFWVKGLVTGKNGGVLLLLLGLCGRHSLRLLEEHLDATSWRSGG